MLLGLLRHGIAEVESPTGHDFDRRLTPAGRAELEQQLDRIQSWGWTPSAILHSPFVRTTQTARAVAARLPTVPSIVEETLAIGTIDGIVRACAAHRAPLLVGHEPTLGRLAAHLVGAPSGAMPVEKAGFVLLELDRLPTTRPARLVLFVPPPPGR